MLFEEVMDTFICPKCGHKEEYEEGSFDHMDCGYCNEPMNKI